MFHFIDKIGKSFFEICLLGFIILRKLKIIILSAIINLKQLFPQLFFRFLNLFSHAILKM